MANHPLTMHNLRKRGTPYINLLQKYPKNLVLIRGILWPVEIETAMAAGDFQILYIDESLMSHGEKYLRATIQKWIDDFALRWNVAGYQASDPYYAADFISKLYALLPTAIRAMREAKEGTAFASNWHKKLRLSSHFGLSKYWQYLNDEQINFLYNNIRKLSYAAGTENNLIEFNERFLESVGLNLSFIRAVRKGTAQNSTVGFQSEPLKDNIESFFYGSSDFVKRFSDRGYTGLFKESMRQNAENIVLRNYNSPDTLRVVDVSQNKTSLSSLRDNIEEAMSYWAYMAFVKDYKGSFEVQVPTFGSITINAKDAFILLTFCLNKISGNNFSHIPGFVCKGVINENIDKPDVLASISRLQNEKASSYYDHFNEMETSRYSLPTEIMNIEGFNVLMSEIRHQKLFDFILINSLNRAESKRIVKYTIKRCYIDKSISLTDGNSVLFSEWLNDMNVGVDENYGLDNCATLLSNIFKSLTDISDIDSGFTENQEKMVELLNEITSSRLFFIKGRSYSQSGSALEDNSDMFLESTSSSSVGGLFDMQTTRLSQSATSTVEINTRNSFVSAKVSRKEPEKLVAYSISSARLTGTIKDKSVLFHTSNMVKVI